MSDVHLSKWYSAGWSPTVGRPLIGCTIRCRDCGHSEEIITARVEGDEYGKARIAAALHKCRLIDRARRGWTLSWTNWTVGFWRSKKLHLWGADLGPLEYVSRRRT